MLQAQDAKLHDSTNEGGEERTTEQSPAGSEQRDCVDNEQLPTSEQQHDEQVPIKEDCTATIKVLEKATSQQKNR